MTVGVWLIFHSILTNVWFDCWSQRRKKFNFKKYFYAYDQKITLDAPKSCMVIVWILEKYHLNTTSHIIIMMIKVQPNTCGRRRSCFVLNFHRLECFCGSKNKNIARYCFKRQHSNDENQNKKKVITTNARLMTKSNIWLFDDKQHTWIVLQIFHARFHYANFDRKFVYIIFMNESIARERIAEI